MSGDESCSDRVAMWNGTWKQAIMNGPRNKKEAIFGSIWR